MSRAYDNLSNWDPVLEERRWSLLEQRLIADGAHYHEEPAADSGDITINLDTGGGSDKEPTGEVEGKEDGKPIAVEITKVPKTMDEAWIRLIYSLSILILCIASVFGVRSWVRYRTAKKNESKDA